MQVAGAAFTLLNSSISTVSVMRNLWLNIYVALSACLRNQLVEDGLWKFLSECHKTLYMNIKFVLNLPTIDPDNQRLQIALLSLIESITEADRLEVDQFLWNSVADNDEETGSTGDIITNFLVRRLGEPAVLEIPGWSELLKRLLLRYEQVRKVAMDSGLVESVIDSLLEMDSTISKDLRVHSRNVLKKKMAEPVKVRYFYKLNV